jgi:hypothetical protein
MTTWEPSKNLDWQADGECAKIVNRPKKDFFFSNKSEEKEEAKRLCFECPVRTECIKWALEKNEIWGIWGGRDEQRIRRTLSVNVDGAEIRRNEYPQCLNCSGATRNLKTVVAENPDGGRWTTVRLVECNLCGFVWRSRTSANAVNAYYAMIEDKRIKKEAEAAISKAKAEAALDDNKNRLF